MAAIKPNAAVPVADEALSGGWGATGISSVRGGPVMLQAVMQFLRLFASEGRAS